tara:strand:- start:9525 stop:10712 length:1188 start_codon:yes stop_codon:yes gene_type:complete
MKVIDVVKEEPQVNSSVRTVSWNLPKVSFPFQLSMPTTLKIPTLFSTFNKFENCTSCTVLESMFYPSMLAFLTCGLLASFVLPGGWSPDSDLAPLVTLGLSNVLPAIAAFGVGYGINGLKSGVVSSIVSIGSVGSTEMTMFLAPVLIAVLVSYIAKLLEYCVNTLVKDRFVMLTLTLNTTLLVLTGIGGIYLSYAMFKPLVEELSPALNNAVESLLNTWKPLAHMIIEPTKVLFFSYSSTLSQLSSGETTTSVYYTLESNPGPGIGLLTGLIFLSPSVVSATIPLALLILAIGGAHFVYYPFVFMYPQTLIALVLGGVTATGIFDSTDFGLTGVPSPANLMSLVKLTESDSLGTLWFGITMSALVTFIATLMLVKPITVIRILTCNRCFRAKVSI